MNIKIVAVSFLFMTFLSNIYGQSASRPAFHTIFSQLNKIHVEMAAAEKKATKYILKFAPQLRHLTSDSELG